MIYESFILEFWYLHCTLTLVISIVEIKNKRQTSFKLPASKKSRNTVVEKNLRVAAHFCKNYAFQLSQGIKKISNQVVQLRMLSKKCFL